MIRSRSAIIERMERPTRKQNRLPKFDYSRDGAYFITICTQGRQPILGHLSVGDDAHIVPDIHLTSYGKVVLKYLNRIPGIDKYVIMPNHIHMILVIDANSRGPMWASAPTQSVSQRIQSFKILVSKELNCHIFQRSFHDHIIRNESDYQRICEYIETNPARWREDCFYTDA